MFFFPYAYIHILKVASQNGVSIACACSPTQLDSAQTVQIWSLAIFFVIAAFFPLLVDVGAVQK